MTNLTDTQILQITDILTKTSSIFLLVCSPEVKVTRGILLNRASISTFTFTHLSSAAYIYLINTSEQLKVSILLKGSAEIPLPYLNWSMPLLTSLGKVSQFFLLTKLIHKII